MISQSFECQISVISKRPNLRKIRSFFAARLTNVCQRPRPTLRLGLDRWEIDRADIDMDSARLGEGNFGTVNKVCMRLGG